MVKLATETPSTQNAGEKRAFEIHTIIDGVHHWKKVEAATIDDALDQAPRGKRINLKKFGPLQGP